MIFCILTLLITMPLFSMDWIDCTAVHNKKELIALSTAVNKFFSSKENKDCIGYINQKILEKTNTHLWAARTILSEQYILLFDHYRLLILNRTTGRPESYYEHQEPTYDGLLTLYGNTLVEKDKKGNIFHSQLIQLDPSTIGSHIYTLEAAATLCALHHELKKDGGPVCNDGFNKFILEQKDFSPFLWPIIAAQGTRIVLPYFFRDDTDKQPEQQACCLCWVQQLFTLFLA